MLVLLVFMLRVGIKPVTSLSLHSLTPPSQPPSHLYISLLITLLADKLSASTSFCTCLSFCVIICNVLKFCHFWQALAKTLTLVQLAYLREQFTLLGPNKSGLISMQNFKTVSTCRKFMYFFAK